MITIVNNRITIVKGNTVTFILTLTNYTFNTGDVAKLTVRKNYKLPIVLEVEAIQLNGAEAVFSLDATETDIESGSYFYDITLFLIDGNIDTVIPTNSFVVLEGITIE